MIKICDIGNARAEIKVEKGTHYHEMLLAPDNEFDKYLGIANHDIQTANTNQELKSYVASILYDNDKKDKEIDRLNSKYNKALELLQDFNMPCECADCKIPDKYCEEHCTDDSECYKKCWDKYIELELKEE